MEINIEYTIPPAPNSLGFIVEEKWPKVFECAGYLLRCAGYTVKPDSDADWEVSLG